MLRFQSQPYETQALIGAYASGKDSVTVFALVLPFPVAAVNMKNVVTKPSRADASNYQWDPPNDAKCLLSAAEPPWKGKCYCIEQARWVSHWPGKLLGVFDSGRWAVSFDVTPEQAEALHGKFVHPTSLKEGQERVQFDVSSCTPRRLLSITEDEASAFGMTADAAVAAYRTAWYPWGIRATDDPWVWALEAWPTRVFGSRVAR